MIPALALMTRDQQAAVEGLRSLQKRRPETAAIMLTALADIFDKPRREELEPLITRIGSAMCNLFFDSLRTAGDKDINSILEGATLLPETQINCRFVWLLVEGRRVLLLNKSSLHFNNPGDCLANGARYQPSLDMECSGGERLLLCVEAAVCIGPLVAKRGGGLKCVPYGGGSAATPCHVTYGGVVYEYKAVNGHVTLKMPWFVGDSHNKLYIYYLKTGDKWFYSYKSDIGLAYHDLQHR